jgi:hypothetical protein
MMKLLMSVFVIRFIVALFENKAKENKKKFQKDTDEMETRHPAGFQLR